MAAAASAAARWLLTGQQTQLTAQLTLGVCLSALFVVVRPLSFTHACLASVFVVVVIGALAQDQHVGTRLSVCALLLGPTWLAAVLAGVLMSIAKLFQRGVPPLHYSAGYIAATCCLSLLGLALLIVVRGAAQGPGRLLGALTLVVFGVMVLLSLLYASVGAMWLHGILMVVLALFLAAASSLVVGLLVLPSLASDEVVRLTAESLQGAGGILSYHTSLLMVDESDGSSPNNTEAKAARDPLPPGGPLPPQQQAQQQHTGFDSQPQQPGRGRRSSIEIAARGADVVRAAAQVHKQASAALPPAFQWMDANAADAASVHSSRSSGGLSISSLASDAAAAATAAASHSSQAQADTTSQQQATGASRLSEQLLAALPHTGQPEDGSFTAAWAAAAAAVTASRRASLSPRLSSEEVEGSSARGPAAFGLAAQPRHLAAAASLEFPEEAGDDAFLQAMRMLSQHGRQQQQQQAQQQQAQQHAHKRGKQLHHSKSAASMASVASVAGSSVAGALHSPFEAAGAPPAAAGAGSTAGSVLSSHGFAAAPVLRHLSSLGHALIGAQQLRAAHSARSRSLGPADGRASRFGAPRTLPEMDGAADGGARLLGPPTTAAQLGPLIGRAKAALASARLEPRWLRPKRLAFFDADAWAKLLDDVELLLVRMSTLEAVSEERRIMRLQLHAGDVYHGLVDAFVLTTAQLAAFTGHCAVLLQQQEATRRAPQLPGWLRRRLRCLAAPRRAADAQPAQWWPSQQGAQTPPPAARAAGAATGRARASPFAAAAIGASADGGPDGLSALLSAMERQGSGVSSYLYEKKAGWQQSRELLRREIDGNIARYWWLVRRASKHAPVKVPPSRSVMVLTFLWPIGNGMLDACERIEASTQLVLRGSRGTAARPMASSPSSGAAAAAAGSRLWRWLRCCRQQQEEQQLPQQQPPQQQPPQQPQPSAWRAWLQEQRHWAVPLSQLLLVQPGLSAAYSAFRRLPAALREQGVRGLLAKRTVQGSAKLFLVSGSVLLLTVLLMAFVSSVRSNAPIFGFTTACLAFQERVEATAEKVVWRVAGTLLGAGLGLAVNSVPGIFTSPWLLLALVAVASAVLGSLARAGPSRTALVLALLTLCALSLCGLEAVCCSPQGQLSLPFTSFLVRTLSVVGACIWAAIVNRALLPWWTADWALEQLADALEAAATLFEAIYDSQHERMRLAELLAHAITRDAGADGQQQQAQQQDRRAAGDAAGGAAPAPAPAPAGPADGRPALPEPEAADGAAWALAAARPDVAAAAAQLSALEAAEAGLHVALRQQVLGRMVAVQLALARESVSWRRGILATPQLVLDSLGAMSDLKEALASQRLALAPFTKAGREGEAGRDGDGKADGSLPHTMANCYSLWAAPLHPQWLQILAAVKLLTAATARQLRRPPRSAAARAAARSELQAALGALEERRLELRHGWLDLRVRLHKAVHEGQPWQALGTQATATAPRGAWVPTDSVHLFTFTYGVSRCLNAFAAVARAVCAAC